MANHLAGDSPAGQTEIIYDVTAVMKQQGISFELVLAIGSAVFRGMVLYTFVNFMGIRRS